MVAKILNLFLTDCLSGKFRNLSECWSSWRVTSRWISFYKKGLSLHWHSKWGPTGYYFDCRTQKHNTGTQIPSGELLYKKDRGAREKFWKEPLRGTKIMFCGPGLKVFFHPLEVSILKQHIISSHIFSDQHPKSTAKAPAVDLLRMNTLRGNKTAFFNP